ASTKNKRQLEHEKRVAGFKRAKARAAAEAVAKKIGGLSVKIARKVGEQDKLYGSVTPHDVQEALQAKGIEVDRRKLDLHEPIKALGDYEIAIRLADDIRATVKVSVVAE
ncbi:MAG TPA: 50S ribosomal protein L9, partial [Myxococcota bacterium]|nr:50S ribosomal protein L9 [Myxococcota bacterium]